MVIISTVNNIKCRHFFETPFINHRPLWDIIHDQMANLKARGLKEAIPKTVAKKSPFPHLIQSNFLLQNIQKNFDKNSRLLLSLSLSLMLDILWKSETIWYCDRNWEKLNWLLPVWNQSYSGILCSVEREMLVGEKMTQRRIWRRKEKIKLIFSKMIIAISSLVKH